MAAEFISFGKTAYFICLSHWQVVMMAGSLPSSHVFLITGKLSLWQELNRRKTPTFTFTFPQPAKNHHLCNDSRGLIMAVRCYTNPPYLSLIIYLITELITSKQRHAVISTFIQSISPVKHLTAPTGAHESLSQNAHGSRRHLQQQTETHNWGAGGGDLASWRHRCGVKRATDATFPWPLKKNQAA